MKTINNINYNAESRGDFSSLRKVYNGKRSGFGMMFAIVLTILVAGLGVLGLKFSSQTLNTTTNEYISIQLDLYLHSTAELAILYIQRNGFVCQENVDCDISAANTAGTGKRADVLAPIEKYITYGPNNEYKFTYKMTPLGNNDGYNPNIYKQDLNACESDYTKSVKDGGGVCFKEETKNVFILDIAGSVTNPITNQTLRVTKRQVVKP